MPAPLLRAVRDQGGGEPLPTAFPTLERAGIRPRRGQVSMFFGYPGAGKTFLALLWALRMNIPTLFFSLDTDPGTMAVRTVAMATGRPQDDIEREMRSGVEFREELARSQIQYSFVPDAELQTLDLEIAAYVELYGVAPELVIVDNLLNVTSSDAENEWSGMRSLMKSFHAMCRLSGMAVWVLHHANEQTKPYGCPPRSAIQGKLAQLPELIVSVGQRQTGSGLELGMAVVKNRRGQADATGESALWFQTDLARMQFFETRQEAWVDAHKRSIA